MGLLARFLLASLALGNFVSEGLPFLREDRELGSHEFRLLPSAEDIRLPLRQPGLEDPAIDPWKMEDLALRSTLLLENPPPEDDNEAVGKEDDGDFPGTTPILWKPPLAELERRLEEQDRRSIIVDPLRIPVLQGRGPPWAKRRRRKRGEKGKRSTACMRRCMTQGLLHPAQCHSLC